jgi:hypothetical protein
MGAFPSKPAKVNTEPKVIKEYLETRTVRPSKPVKVVPEATIDEPKK